MLKISNFQRELLRRAMADAVGGGRVGEGEEVGVLLEGRVWLILNLFADVRT